MQSSGFEVPETSNPRPSRLSRATILQGRVLFSQTCSPSKFCLAKMVIPQPARPLNPRWVLGGLQAV